MCFLEESDMCASFRVFNVQASAKKVHAWICGPATARDLESA